MTDLHSAEETNSTGMSETSGEPAHWSVIEIFGHRRHVGLVSRELRYGTTMCRIDVPGENGELAATFYYGGGSIFSETPITEERARKLIAEMRPVAPARLSYDPHDPDFEDADDDNDF